jgi:hypothetical protein
VAIASVDGMGSVGIGSSDGAHPKARIVTMVAAILPVMKATRRIKARRFRSPSPFQTHKAAPSGQGMPERRQDDGQRGQERTDGGERDTDLHSLVLGD